MYKQIIFGTCLIICSSLIPLALPQHYKNKNSKPLYTLRSEPGTLRSALYLRNATSDVIKNTNHRLRQTYLVQYQDNFRSPEFEVGYTVYRVQEEFRKMVDIYNTSVLVYRKFFTMELLLYLEEIENRYWEVMHLIHMLHELERKYDKRVVTDEYEELENMTNPDNIDELEKVTDIIRIPSFHNSHLIPTVTQRVSSSKKKRHERQRWKNVWQGRIDQKSTPPRPYKYNWTHHYGWDVPYPW